jgi:hypothetical protein
MQLGTLNSASHNIIVSGSRDSTTTHAHADGAVVSCVTLTCLYLICRCQSLVLQLMNLWPWPDIFLNAFAVVNCILHKLTCKYFIAATCIAYDRTDHNHYRSLLKAGVESFF